MAEWWSAVARRLVEGLDVQPGELVLVRERAGRLDLLLEVLLAIETRGATPLPEVAPADYQSRLLATAAPETLARWDQHRDEWLRRADRVLVLGGAVLDLASVPPAALEAWEAAEQRLDTIEQGRRLPYLVAAIPTAGKARQLGVELDVLEAHLLPSLAASVAELRGIIDRAMAVAQGGQTLVIRTGERAELRMTLGDRRWLGDDGLIDADDRARGAIVSNLPAGSIYTTVLEESTEGQIWLPRAAPARDVMLTFAAGRIVDIAAAEGGAELQALFARHSGEPGRVAHIGVGLNPYLTRPIGWTLVDEHVQGYLFLSLGENRYMGGQNVSSLNIDYAVPEATLLVDGRAIVEDGRVV